MVEDLNSLRQQMAERSLSDFIRLGWPHIDPAKYLSNWHIDAICEHLEAVSRGEIRNLIINVPPRHMKSLSVSVAWPAWTWLQKPTAPLMGPHVKFLASSYASSLSIRDNVKCRRLMLSPWYQAMKGDKFQFVDDQNTKTRFENDQFGYRIATSVDGATTGEGGDVIIVDDPLSAGDASSDNARATVLSWWDEVMTTRLNDPKTGAYVIIMQRLHEKDLVGHLLAREPDNWSVLCLPARYEHNHPNVWPRDPRSTDGELLWPDRMGEQEVSKLETALGSFGAAGQLQQRPAPRSGGLFEKRWFEIVDAAPTSKVKVRKWDLAGTAVTTGSNPDYTVGVLMSKDQGGFHYIEDIIRFRGSPHEVEQAIINTASSDGKSVTIGLSQDPGQAGKFQVNHLTRLLSGWVVRSEPETGSKELRATPFSAQCEAGNVKLVKGNWNDDFINELIMFPNATHDDQVDAAAGAFSTLTVGSDMNSFIQILTSRAQDAKALRDIGRDNK
jgi:predicted phage terminase large subunit-like protein